MASRVRTTDLDVTDYLFLVDHYMAETQTVLWASVLDRLAGPRPPTLVVDVAFMVSLASAPLEASRSQHWPEENLAMPMPHRQSSTPCGGGMICTVCF
jgi:hypothetical protein